MSVPTETGGKPVATVSESADGSLIENIGQPPEILDGGGEVSADAVSELLVVEQQFYELDPETGLRVDDTFDSTPEGEPEAEGEVDTELAVTEVEEVEDTDEESASPEETTDTQGTDDAEPEAEGEPEPFRFKADGSEFELDGVSVDEDDNIVIPRETWERGVQPHLADRRVWQAKEQDYKKAMAALDPSVNPVIKQAEVLITKVNSLLSDEEALESFVEEFSTNRDKLIAAAEKAKLEQEIANLKAARTGETQEADRSNVEEMISLGISTIVDQAFEMDEFKGLDRDHVSGLLSDVQSSIFRAATDAEAQELGVTAGEIVVDYTVIQKILQRESQRTESTKARNAAKRKNSAATTRKKAPATPDPKPGRSSGRQPPKSKAEWEANLRKQGM